MTRTPSNRIVVIPGAGRGIGLAAAHRLAGEGPIGTDEALRDVDVEARAAHERRASA